MKIKQTRNYLYILSSVMVLGLALLSFDPSDTQHVSGTLSPTPTGSSDTAHTPVPTQTDTTPAPTLSPTPTSTPSPTPTPTPSLAQKNAEIDIIPATDELGVRLSDAVTNYLTDLYSEETLHVKELLNITCYYKPGVHATDYFVYASFDIHYEGSNVFIPAFKEYVVSVTEENCSVLTEEPDADTSEALFLSRASGTLGDLYIQELLRCYMNAKLAVDETLLSSLVTDPSYLKIKNIEAQTQYIEEYKNLEFVILPVTEDIEEFDYVVYVINDVKIVNISTLAPGMDEYKITMDENNYPLIFTGITSSAGDAVCTAFRESEEYLTKLNEVVERMTNAMLQDPSLLEFVERLNNASGEAE